MVDWREKWTARIGLRCAGLALLGAAWGQGASLHRIVATQMSMDASPAQLLLAGLLFASASAGLCLACIGPGLWAPVTVSDRWA